MADRIFVTGASGHLGGLVVRHLLASGVGPDRIIAGTRTPESRSALATAGVEVRRADFEDGDGLKAALEDVHTVLLVSTERMDGGGHRMQQHRTAVAAAVAAGVRRIAYTSVPDPEASLLQFAPDHVDTERAIRETGLPYLIFRNGWYQENLLLGLPGALSSGQYHSSAGGGKITYAAREDVAAGIAAALIRPPADSRIFTLTGPDTLSIDDVCALAASVNGRAVEVVNVPEEPFKAGLVSAGLPEWLATVLFSIETATRAGQLAISTGDLAALVGKPLRSLATFMEENRAALVAA
jgi:NAD(P)H dehydrogenase (quinone)